MNPKLLMSAAGIFIIGTLLACLCSGRWLMNGETDIIVALASFNTLSTEAGGMWQAPKTIGTYWNAIATALSWDYPFLESGWATFLRIFLWIVSIGTVWGILQVFVTVISGLASAAGGIIRAFRGI